MGQHIAFVYNASSAEMFALLCEPFYLMGADEIWKMLCKNSAHKMKWLALHLKQTRPASHNVPRISAIYGMENVLK